MSELSRDVDYTIVRDGGNTVVNTFSQQAGVNSWRTIASNVPFP